VILLERTYRFCASHRYWRDEWTDEQNLATFGRCALPHGHGHNYRFTIAIEGPPDPKTGMIADLGPLDALVTREILDRFDHKNINAEVAHFRTVMPTTENLARYVFETLAPRIPRGRLVQVTLQEDEFLSATCRPPDA
jgi:6-pyruvoyltetrahydropterin/6-carboxytetrahydropterin synthase